MSHIAYSLVCLLHTFSPLLFPLCLPRTFMSKCQEASWAHSVTLNWTDKGSELGLGSPQDCRVHISFRGQIVSSFTLNRLLCLPVLMCWYMSYMNCWNSFINFFSYLPSPDYFSCNSPVCNVPFIMAYIFRPWLISLAITFDQLFP